MKSVVVALVLLALAYGGVQVVVFQHERAEADAARRLHEQVTHPAADVVAMADRIRFTRQGREIFYRTVPRFVGAAAVMEKCGDVSDHADDSWDGCFDGSTITIYRPTDPRLAGSMVITAAHEFLHAAYDEMDEADQETLDDLVAAEARRLPADSPVRKQIAASSRRDKSHLGTERFAYLGTEVSLKGGFAPQLERIYARYFKHRAAIVATYRRSQRVFVNIWNEVVAEESTNAGTRSQIDADKAAYEADRVALENQTAQAQAMTPEELAGTSVTWSRAGGAEQTAPLADYLRTESERLQALYDGFPAREAELAARIKETAARRADAEALMIDAQASMAERRTS